MAKLFALGHRGETLSRYGDTTVNVEWPPLLAARYRALVWIPGDCAEKPASVAADMLASVNNTIKRVAESALRRVGEGARAQIDTDLKELGKVAVKWTRRLLVVTLGAWLVQTYPSTFKWLPPILDFLKALPF